MCIKNGPPPKGHPANLTQLWEALESTWASIPVERFQHLVESTWASISVERFQHLVVHTRRIEAVLRAKGEEQLNMRKVFLMFCPVYFYDKMTY